MKMTYLGVRWAVTSSGDRALGLEIYIGHVVCRNISGTVMHIYHVYVLTAL